MSEELQVYEIPIGNAGLTGNKNPSLVPPSALTIANNLDFFQGNLRKEGGAAKFNSSAISGAPQILGGFDWWPDDATQRTVVIGSDGKIYKDSGSGTFATTLKSGLSISSNLPMQMVAGGANLVGINRKLFIFTGANALQVLSGDGATTADVTTPPADWSGVNQPTFGCIHDLRLFAGGNANDPHRIYYTNTTSHETFTGAGSGTISVYPGEGLKIVGAVSFRGFLFVFKYPKGIYVIDTSNTDVTLWTISKLTGAVGASRWSSIVSIEDGIIFFSAQGTFNLITQVNDVQFAVQNISPETGIGSFIKDNVNLTQLDHVCSVFNPLRREAHFGMPGAGATTNNRRMVVDFSVGAPRYRWSDRDTAVSLWNKSESGQDTMIYGDATGTVWRMDQDNFNFNSVGYSGEFKTAQLDLGNPIARKNGKFLELLVDPAGTWDLSIDVTWDEERTQTYSFTLGGGTSVLDTFVLDTDVLADFSALNVKKRITGSGRRVTIRGVSNVEGQGFAIARIFMHYTIGNERI